MSTVSTTDVDMSELNTILGPVADASGHVSLSRFYGANNFIPGPPIPTGGPISFSMFQDETRISGTSSATVSGLTSSGLQVNWSIVPTAISYSVTIYSASDSSMTVALFNQGDQVPTTSQAVVPPTFFSFSPVRGRYYGAVVSVNYGNGIYVDSTISTPGLLFPYPPISSVPFIDSVVSNSITIEYTSNAANTYKAQVYESDVSTSFTRPVTIPLTIGASPATITDAFVAYPGKYYAVKTIAYNLNGSNPSGFSPAAMIPPPPTTGVVMSPFDRSFRLAGYLSTDITWDINPYASSYIVTIDAYGGGTVASYSNAADVNGAIIEFLPTPSTFYKARVRALNLTAYSDSEYSELVYAPGPPPAPVNVTLSNFTQYSTFLSWQAGTDILDASGGYGLYFMPELWSATDSAMTSNLTKFPLDRTIIPDSIVTGQTNYILDYKAVSGNSGLYYAAKVNAINIAGSNSTFSDSVFMPLPPTAPTPRLLNMSRTSYDISWTQNPGETYQYQLWQTDVSGNFGKPTTGQNAVVVNKIVGTTDITTTTVSDHVTLGYGAYYYAVKMNASNLLGQSDFSGFSAPQQVIPPIPLGVYCAPFTDSNELTVTWNNNAYADFYTIELFEASNAELTGLFGPVQTRSTLSNYDSERIIFTPTGGKYYVAWVSATNLGGSSEFSAYTTPGRRFPAAPQPPASASFSNLTRVGAFVSWTASPDSPDPATTYNYTIYSATDSGMTQNLTAIPADDQDPPATTEWLTPQTQRETFFTATPGLNGLYYAVSVRGSNFAGNSTPTFSTSIFFPAPPQQPVAEILQLTPSNVQISWTPVGTETYSLQVFDSTTTTGFSTGSCNSILYNTIPSSSPYTATGSFGGDGYYYAAQVIASNSVGQTARSIFTNIVQPAPSAPSNVSMDPFSFSSGGVVTSEVAWTPPLYATGYTVDIYSDTEPTLDSPATLVPSATVVLTGQYAASAVVEFAGTSGLYYGAKVTARSLGGSNTSGFSSNVGVGNTVYIRGAPSAPTNVNISHFFDLGQFLDVSWTAGAVTRNAATYYTVEILARDLANDSQPVLQEPALELQTVEPYLLTSPKTLPVYFIPVSGWSYSTRVTAYNEGGSNSTTSSSSSYPYAPDRPVVSISRMTYNELDVSWSPISGETYRAQLFKATAANLFALNPPRNPFKIVTVTTSPATISGSYADGQFYAAKIVASNPVGTATSLFSTAAQPTPNAPTDIVFSTPSGTLPYLTTIVEWINNSEGLVSNAVSIYDGSGPTLVVTSNTTGDLNAASISFTADASHSYYATVTAISYSGSAVSSNSSNVVIPSPPTLSSVTVSNAFTYGDYVDVSWVTTGSSYVTIDISGSFEQSPSSTTRLTSLPFGASNYPVFFQPTLGQAYYAIVTAYNSVGGNASNTSDQFNYPVKPSAPTAYLSNLTTSSADVSWTTPDVNNGETFNITLWQGNDYNSFALKDGLLPVGYVSGATTAVTLVGTFTDDFYYSAKVEASNRAGTSSSAFSSILHPVPNPTGDVTFGPFTRHTPYANSLVQWSSPLSIGYFLVGVYPSNSSVADVSYTVPAGTNAVIVTNDWLSGSNYRVGVRTSNSTAVSTETFSTYQTFPDQPGSFTVNLLRYTQSNEQIYWSAATNSLYYTVGIYDLSTNAYVVNPTTNISNFASYTTSSSPRIIDFSPIAGHVYQTIVTSYGLGGSSSNSDISFAYPSGTTNPTDLSFVSISSSRIDLSWTAIQDTTYYASVFTAPDETSLATNVETDELITDAFVARESPYVYGSFPYTGFIYAVKLRASNVNGFAVQRTNYSRVLMPPPTDITSVTLAPFGGTIPRVTSLLTWPSIGYATSYTTNLFQEDTSGLVYSNVSTNPNIYADVLVFSNTSGFYPTNGKYYYAAVVAESVGGITGSPYSQRIYFPNAPNAPSAVTMTNFFTNGNYVTVNWTDTQSDIDAATYYTIRIDQSGVPITTQNPLSTEKLTTRTQNVFFTGQIGTSYTATVSSWNLGGSNSLTSSSRTVPAPPPMPHPAIDEMTLSNITVSWDPVTDVSYSLTVYESQDYNAFAQNNNPSTTIEDYLLTTNPQSVSGDFTYDDFYYSVRIKAFYGTRQSVSSAFSAPTKPKPLQAQDVSMIGITGSSTLVTSTVMWAYQNFPTSYQIKLYSSPSYSPFTPTLVSNYTIERNLSAYEISYLPTRGTYYKASVIGSNFGGAAPESELSSQSIYFPNLPDAPSNVVLSNFFTSGRMVDISWEDTQTGPDAPTYYTATFFDVSGTISSPVGYQRPAAKDKISNDLGYDLKPIGGHYYYATVYAWNLAGSNSSDSSSGLFPFLPAVPAPVITNMTTDSMDISWTTYPGETYTAAVWGATNRTSFGENTSVKVILDSRPVTSSPYTITDASAFTFDDNFYSVTVTASNLNSNVPSAQYPNYSPPSQPLPLVPMDVSMYAFLGTTSQINWKTSRYASTYSINVYSGATLISNFVTANSTNTYKVDILAVPGTYYSAAVAASNLGGLTAFSTPTSEVYYQNNPYPASNVTLTNFFTDGQYATVSWDTSSGLDQADYYNVQIIGVKPPQLPIQTSIVTNATSPRNVYFTPTGGYTYYAAVYAYNNTGNTDASSSQIYYPSLIPVDSVTIADMTPDTITIDWIQQPDQKYSLWVYGASNTSYLNNALRLAIIRGDNLLTITGDAFANIVGEDISGTQFVGGSNRMIVDSSRNFVSEGQYYAALIGTYRTFGVPGYLYSPWSAPNEPRPTPITSVTVISLSSAAGYPKLDVSWSHASYSTSNSISIYEVDNSTNFTGDPVDVCNNAVQSPYVAGNVTLAEIPFYSTSDKYGKYFTTQVTATNLNSASAVSPYSYPAFYFPNPPSPPTNIGLSHFFTLGQYIDVYWTAPPTSPDDATHYKLSVVDQSGNIIEGAVGDDKKTLLTSLLLKDYNAYTNNSPYEIYFTPNAGYTYTVNIYAYNVANDGSATVVASSESRYYSGIPAKPTPVITRLTPTDISVSWTPQEGERYTMYVYGQEDSNIFKTSAVLDPIITVFDLSGTIGTLSYAEKITTGRGEFAKDGFFYAVKILAKAYAGANGENLSLYSEIEQPAPLRPAFIGAGQLITSGTSTYLDISWGYSTYGESNTVNVYKVTNGASFAGNQADVGDLTDISYTTPDNYVATNSIRFDSRSDTRGQYFTANVTTGNYGGTVTSAYSYPPIYFPNYPNKPLNVTLSNFTKNSRIVSWEPAGSGDPPTLGYYVEMYSVDSSGVVQQVGNFNNTLTSSNVIVKYTQAANYSTKIGFTAENGTYYYARVVASNFAGSNRVDASSSTFYYPELPTAQIPVIQSITPNSATITWTPVLGETYYVSIVMADIVRNLTYGTLDADGNVTGITDSIASNIYAPNSPFVYYKNAFTDQFKIYAATLLSSNLAGPVTSIFSLASEVSPSPTTKPVIDVFTSSNIDVVWTPASNAESYAVKVFDASSGVLNTFYYTQGSCNAAIVAISNRTYGAAVSRPTAALFSWSPEYGKYYYVNVVSLNLGVLYSNTSSWGPYTSSNSDTIYFPNIPPPPIISSFTISSLSNASLSWTDGSGATIDKATYFNASVGSTAVIDVTSATFYGDVSHSLLTIAGLAPINNSGYFYGTNDYDQYIGSYNGSNFPLILTGTDFSNISTKIYVQQGGDYSGGTYLVTPRGNYFTSNKSTITGTGYYSTFQDSVLILPPSTSFFTITGDLPFNYTFAAGRTIYCEDLSGGQADTVTGATIISTSPLAARMRVSIRQTLQTFTHDAYVSNYQFSVEPNVLQFYAQTSVFTVTTMSSGTLNTNYGLMYSNASANLIRLSTIANPSATSGTYNLNTTLNENPTTGPIYVYNKVWWAGSITDNGDGTADITNPNFDTPYASDVLLVSTMITEKLFIVKAQITGFDENTNIINYRTLNGQLVYDAYFYPQPTPEDLIGIQMTGIVPAGQASFTNNGDYTGVFTVPEDYSEIYSVNDSIVIALMGVYDIEAFGCFIVTNATGTTFDVSGLAPETSKSLLFEAMTSNVTAIGRIFPNTLNYKVIQTGNASFSYTPTRMVVTGTYGTDFRGSFVAGGNISVPESVTINIISQISGTSGGAGTYTTDYNVNFSPVDTVFVTGRAVIPAANMTIVSNSSTLAILPPNTLSNGLGTSTNAENRIDTLIGKVLPEQVWSGRLTNGQTGELTDISFAIADQISTTGTTSNRYGIYEVDKTFETAYYPVSSTYPYPPLPGFTLTTPVTFSINPGYASCVEPTGVMEVTGTVTANLIPGMTVYGNEFTSYSRIVSQNTGTAGKQGKYSILPAQNLGCNLSNVYGFQSNTNQIPNSTIQITGPQSDYTITNLSLQSGYYYSALVQAYNRAGYSFTIFPTSPIFLPYAPPKPANVEITNMTSSNFTASWDLVLGYTYTANLYGVSSQNATPYTTTGKYYITSILASDVNGTITIWETGTGRSFNVTAPMVKLLSDYSVDNGSVVIPYTFTNSAQKYFAITVTASNIVGTTTSSYSPVYQPQPTKPTNVAITSFRREGLGVSWTGGTFADSYYVYVTDLSKNDVIFASNTMSNVTYVQYDGDLIATWGSILGANFKATVVSSNSTVAGIPTGTLYALGNPNTTISDQPSAAVTNTTTLANYSSDSSSIRMPSALSSISNVNLIMTTSNVTISWSPGTRTINGTFNFPQQYRVLFHRLGNLLTTPPAGAPSIAPSYYYEWFQLFANPIIPNTYSPETTITQTVGIIPGSSYSVAISNYDGLTSNFNYLERQDISDSLSPTYAFYTVYDPEVSFLKQLRFHQFPIPPTITQAANVKNIRWDGTYSNLLFNLDTTFVLPNAWSGRTYSYTITTVNDGGGLSGGISNTTVAIPITAGSNSIPVPTFQYDPYIKWYFSITPSNAAGSGTGTGNMLMPIGPISNVKLDKFFNTANGRRLFYVSWNGGVNANFNDISGSLFFDTSSSMANKQVYPVVGQAQSPKLFKAQWISPSTYISSNSTNSAHTTSATFQTVFALYADVCYSWLNNKYVAPTIALYSSNINESITSSLGQPSYVIGPPSYFSSTVYEISEIKNNSFVLRWNLHSNTGPDFSPALELCNKYRVAILTSDVSETIAYGPYKDNGMLQGPGWNRVIESQYYSNVWVLTDIGIPTFNGNTYELILNAQNNRQGYTSNLLGNWYTAALMVYNDSGTNITNFGTEVKFFYPLG